ncbi:MAG: hypothetical protein OXC72_09985 [Roseovarius sp.]|nr:hypothetical protein [Roseovarius sp.]MCY4292068.1 hypothetical protein [Roseovarius sp.]
MAKGHFSQRQFKANHGFLISRQRVALDAIRVGNHEFAFADSIGLPALHARDAHGRIDVYLDFRGILSNS